MPNKTLYFQSFGDSNQVDAHLSTSNHFDCKSYIDNILITTYRTFFYIKEYQHGTIN